jgi:hypothetical protein
MTMQLLAQLEAPPEGLHAPANGVLFFIIFGVMAAVTVGWAYWYTWRLPERGRLLLILTLEIIGAAIAVGVEATFDVLGKIHYAQNSHPMIYESFGQHLPAHLIFGYIPFCGVLPFILALKMREGLTRRTLVIVALATGVAGAMIDGLGALTNSWGYYGSAPSNLLGVAPQMAGEPLVGAALLMLLIPLLRGPWILALVLLPGSVLAGAYAFSGWPTYVVIHANAPGWANWVAGAITLAICAGMIWFVATVVGKDDLTADKDRERSPIGAMSPRTSGVS